MAFTENQIKAIKAKDSDILVSAAAGSGKTTVLVERIIQRILDKDNPIDIDHMLVLTFTKAAAAQMREKIHDAIEKKRLENPMDEHIVKQSMLVQNAQISTFHGFCQNIIKNHFYEIDADPELRVMDETEGTLLKMDAISRILENAYELAEEDFLKVADSYAEGKNDKSLEDLILRIYNLSQAQPDPDKWLTKCENAYKAESVEELINTDWFKTLFNYLKKSAEDALFIAEKMIDICNMESGPSKYLPMGEDDKGYAESLINASSIEEFISISRVHEKKALARISAAKDGVNPELQKLFKDKREIFYGIIDDISKVTVRSLNDEISIMKNVSPLTETIISLVRDFSKEYAAAKIDAGVIDFNDMEHLAIKILRNDKSQTAAEYRDFYEEIYVDEYQDSNLTQEEIISIINHSADGRCGNVFMVGDVKQSIYRFRMARPDLFLEKYNSFNHLNEEGKGLRIDLSDNFRSRTEVLDATNEVFEQIMNKSIGGIEYDDAARLHYGHLYDEAVSDSDYKAELILALADENVSSKEAEVYAIATKIKEIVGKMEIKDSKSGLMRKVQYSDIVILLRSMTGRDTLYRRILMENGIPAYVTTGVGYFSTKEVESVLGFLTVIDNPLQDIQLAATLRSVFGKFSDEELALLCAGNNGNYLYDLLVLASNDEYAFGDDSVKNMIPEIRNKSIIFLEMLNHFREESEYMSVYEILREIIDGPFGDYARSGKNGVQADANLNMLLKKAEDFGKLSYKGLFHFLRYIDQMRKYEIDYGEAGISDENDSNVRIMTIHKSKGLEFPVVFVSGISKSRNTNDEKNEVICDPDYGIGLNYVDIDKRTKQSTYLRQFLSNRIRKENIAEEIRVLYVALTRAKEKLYLVGSIKDAEKDFYNKEKPLDKCSSYLDMIAHAYGKKSCFDNINIIEMGYEDFILSEIENAVTLERKYLWLNEAKDRYNPDSLTKEELSKYDILDFVYPYASEFPEYAKVSVSELKKKSMEETFENDGYEPYVPDFIREQAEDNSAGAFYGTAFHRMLELWDYSDSCGRESDVTEDEIADFYDKMCDCGKISRVQIDAVRPSEILTFLQSDIAKRMAVAASNNKLFREQPFFIGIDPGMMLVQGIIDAYWIEDDGIVILDYKTDRVKLGQDLCDRYHVQLEYYEKALERLTEIKVKEKIIYAARLKETVILN